MPYPYQQNFYPSFNPYQRQDFQPQMPQGMQTPMQQAAQQGYLMRVVSARTEAEASPAPLDGTPAFFYDVANQKIYQKAFLPDGTAPIKTFGHEEDIPKTEPKYVTQEQFETVCEGLARLRKTVGRLVNGDDE